MEDGSKQSFPHPSLSGPRVDRHSLSLAQPQGWTWAPKTLLACPSQPTEAIMEVAGLTTSTSRGPLTPGTGLSVEEAGESLTECSLPRGWTHVLPGAWSSRPCAGDPGHLRCCWEFRSLWPIGGKRDTQRAGSAVPPCPGVGGQGGVQNLGQWSEAGRQCLQPEPGHSAGQAGAGFRCRAPGRQGRPGRRGLTVSVTADSVDGPGAPEGWHPVMQVHLQMGMQVWPPLGENPTSHITWFLHTGDT